MSPRFQVKIDVFPKPGITDPGPAGQLRKMEAIMPEHRQTVKELKIGKLIGFMVEAVNEDEALQTTNSLVTMLLVNDDLENYEIRSITEIGDSTG